MKVAKPTPAQFETYFAMLDDFFEAVSPSWKHVTGTMRHALDNEDWNSICAYAQAINHRATGLAMTLEAMGLEPHPDSDPRGATRVTAMIIMLACKAAKIQARAPLAN